MELDRTHAKKKTQRNKKTLDSSPQASRGRPKSAWKIIFIEKMDKEGKI